MIFNSYHVITNIFDTLVCYESAGVLQKASLFVFGVGLLVSVWFGFSARENFQTDFSSFVSFLILLTLSFNVFRD